MVLGVLGVRRLLLDFVNVAPQGSKEKTGSVAICEYCYLCATSFTLGPGFLVEKEVYLVFLYPFLSSLLKQSSVACAQQRCLMIGLISCFLCSQLSTLSMGSSFQSCEMTDHRKASRYP